MTSDFTLFMAGLSDTGVARDHNEDFIAWHEAPGLALLADGMGGHSAGDVASRLSVARLEEILLPALEQPLTLKPNQDMSRHATLLHQALNEANRAVFEAGTRDAAHKGMGTTLVAVLFFADRAVVGHVGDSRAYRLRGPELTPLTADHSLVRQLVEEGVISAEEAQDSPFTHVITQAVGAQETVAAEIQEFDARPGDVYLLCSDGLTDLVEDGVIADTLLAAQGNWMRAAQRLVDLANQQGGRDNISVLIVGVGPPRAGAGQ